MNRACLGLTVLGAVFLGLFHPVYAQPAGTLSGSVQDQTGASLASVTITLHGSVTREARTDSAGTFRFDNLPAGDYELNAALSGFDTVRRPLRLQPGSPVSLTLTLAVTIREEVVVSAAKSGDADIQEIPMAIGTVSGAALTRLDTRSIEQAASLLPSVTFTQNTTFGQLSIRGIGTNLVNAGGDPSSAFYADGVYLARPAMLFVDLFDLERVEVLRGPQGTLYGRNAVGGALNLVSKDPGNALEASARFTGSNFDGLRADARVSGPLKRDRVMGSVAIARGTRDGYVRDLDHLDHPLGGDDDSAARGKLRVVLGRSAELLVAGDYSNRAGTPLTYNKVLQVKPGFQVDNPPALHDVRTSTLASGHVLQSGASARLTTALTPSTTLVSLTAFRRLDHEYWADGDVTELSLNVTHVAEKQHQWSEEVTVTDRRSRLTTIAGAFLFAEKDTQPIGIDQPAQGIHVVLDPRVDANSLAVFGQTTFDVSTRWSATIGLRYTREQKNIDNRGERYALDAARTPIPGSAYAYTDSIVHGDWTPRVGLEAKLPGQAIAYVSATKGFKSGGFNLSSTQPGRGFEPEWAWNYEAGLKTELLQGRARVNVAAFTMDYTNLQVQTPIGVGVFDIRNAAAATVRGVEVEAGARIGRGFGAGGHLTWLEAAYDQYIAVAIGGVVGDVAGNSLNNAPQWAGRAWAEWNGRMTSSDLLSLTIDATAQSTVFYTPFNDNIQRQLPYALVGARVEYGPSHRRWSVNVYGRNLTNTGYIMAAFATSAAAYGGRPGAPRQFGVQAVFRR